MDYIFSPKRLGMSGKVILVAGARPNFMKLAPVHRSLVEIGLDCVVVHTGQHYDHEMSQIFFEELDIPPPDINLEVGSSSHAQQTAQIMTAFEKVCLDINPAMVVVFGDVNSTIACALVAKKLQILVSHVESGLRSRDMKMPEEINRILTDHISDFLFTTSEGAGDNLSNEGIGEEKIFFVGNVMIDTLKKQIPKIEKSTILEKLNIEKNKYDLLTLHRPSNVDRKNELIDILEKLSDSAFQFPIIFPAHPRTQKKISSMGLDDLLEKNKFRVINPQGYNDFLFLQKYSRSIWTDSGGIQEESSWLGVPCFTLRENTERPVTITHGTNILVTSQTLDYGSLIKDIGNHSKKTEIPKWDGKSSSRIAEVIGPLLLF